MLPDFLNSKLMSNSRPNAPSPRRPLIEFVKNFAVMLGGVLCALFLAELFLRLWHPIPPIAADLFLVTSPHSDESQARTARRSLSPGVRTRHTTSEFDVAVRINSKGLRDVERPYAKPRGSTRVLMLGDSFTFGYGVEESERFSNRAQDALHRRVSKSCEVINAGVPSWGTADELMFLREEGFRYQPDVVALCLFENDLRDNVERNMFVLRDKKFITVPRSKIKASEKSGMTGDPFSNKVLSVASEQSAPTNRPRVGFLTRHFHLARLIRMSLFNLSQSKESKREAEEFDAAPLQARTEYAQRLTIEIVEAMRRDCQKHGANFIMIVIPDAVYLSLGYSNSFIQLPILGAWAKKQPANTILDLLPALKDAAREGEVYFKIDPHLNARGHAVAGRAVEEFLERGVLARRVKR
jgi:hypothetical protein